MWVEKMLNRAHRKRKAMDMTKTTKKLPHVSDGLPGNGVTHNDDGKEVKIDKAGRPYPVGKDGFRLMKTTRPPEYTPAEWAMMRKYCTEEEKAEVKGGGKKKKEEPKSKGTEISTPKRRRCRCPVPREFGLCFGIAGVELIGSTIGDCERTCQRSRTHRMGSTWLSSIGSG